MTDVELNIKSRREYAQEKVAKFQADIAEGTHIGSTLEWSSGVFEAAAIVEVCDQTLLNLNQPNSSVGLVKKWLATKLAKGARFPTRSTNPTSNLMAEYRTAAYASIFEEYFQNS